MDPELLNQLLEQSKSLLIGSLLLSLACAVICGLIAVRRKLPRFYWVFMGFVFGPFAIPFVFMAKPKLPPASKP